MKTTTEIDVYEIGNEEVARLGRQITLTITSHWNDSDMVVLRLPGGKSVTVVGAELRTAIENATRR